MTDGPPPHNPDPPRDPEQDNQEPASDDASPEPSETDSKRPPRDLTIPEILRTPIDHPAASHNRRSASDRSTLASMGRGIAVATEFIVSILAGAALGYVLDNYVFGSVPFCTLGGMVFGLVAGMVRVIRYTQALARTGTR